MRPAGLRRGGAALAILLMASAAVCAEEAPEAPETPGQDPGTTIVGEQDAAVGLFLAPWKNESRSGRGRPPGWNDPSLAPVEPAGYARASEHYAMGRAYRLERVLRAR